MNTGQVGYGPQIGRSPEGFPVYQYTDPQSKLTTFVVVLPDGRAFYSDERGKIVSTPVFLPTGVDSQVGLALLGGIIGLALGGGPLGAIVGGILRPQSETYLGKTRRFRSPAILNDRI